MNPNDMITLLKGIRNPKQAVLNMIGNNNTNPMIKNLVEMANNGNKQGIEEFARNYYKEQGKDFDKEFSNFMDNFK